MVSVNRVSLLFSSDCNNGDKVVSSGIHEVASCGFKAGAGDAAAVDSGVVTGTISMDCFSVSCLLLNVAIPRSMAIQRRAAITAALDIFLFLIFPPLFWSCIHKQIVIATFPDFSHNNTTFPTACFYAAPVSNIDTDMMDLVPAPAVTVCLCPEDQIPGHISGVLSPLVRIEQQMNCVDMRMIQQILIQRPVMQTAKRYSIACHISVKRLITH